MKKQIIRTLKLALTAIFLYLLWRVPDHGALAERFTQLDYQYLALFVLVGVAMLLVSNAKWHVLLQIHGNAPSFTDTLRIYFIGYYFTALLPSSFGGDGARVYLAGRRTGSATAAASSVFMERVTGLVLLLTIVATVPVVRPDLGQHPAFAIPGIICAGAIAVIVIGTIFRRTLSRGIQAITDGLLRWERARFMAPLLRWMARFLGDSAQALNAVSRQPRIAWRVWGWTAVFYALVWINILVAYRTFGFNPPVDIVPVTPVVMFVASLPVAAGGNLGYTEGVYAYYFSLVGIAVEATLAVALLIRLKVWVLGGIGMLLFLTGSERRAMDGRQAPTATVSGRQS